jgi:hypothetical protein
MGFSTKGIEVFSRDSPLIGNHLGADSLSDETASWRIASHDSRTEGIAKVFDD